MKAGHLALLLVFAALPAWAAPVAWQARPGASRLGFTAYWQGQPVKGRFPQFQMTARLDPAHPAGGSIKLEIDTAKLTTQSPDIARAMRGKAWFDVKDYPKASFTSESLTKKADDKFRLSGQLRLKGHEKTVSFPLEITQDNGKLKLAGTLTLDRDDFAIGTGRWAHDKMIAQKVNVAFSLVLARGD
ncbi:MAG: YceI family protein [Acetobacteraceae bacterium]